jgi:hypothetical protein
LDTPWGGVLLLAFEVRGRDIRRYKAEREPQADLRSAQVSYCKGVEKLRSIGV